MKKINIHGKNGQHGSDLERRGIFEGLEIITNIKPDTVKGEEIDSNLIIIPISETKSLIESIMGINASNHIINFSGIMSTTPKEIRRLDGVSNFHFLFGPKTKE